MLIEPASLPTLWQTRGARAKNNLQVDNLDSTTMIYTWLSHSLKKEIEYDEYNQTLKALGIEENSIGDIIYKEAGKRNRIQLLDFSQRGTLEARAHTRQGWEKRSSWG